MNDDDILKDDGIIEEPEDLDVDLEAADVLKKKKDLIDDDTVSLDDEADEELDEEEEPFDDVTNY